MTSRPSVRHPSHNHPLRLFKPQTDDEQTIICSGCDLELTNNQSFKCTKPNCDYILHKSCFELPNQIHHKSHPNHYLTLSHSPPNNQTLFTCHACGEYGSGFVYTCIQCNYNIHVSCISMPETLDNHKEHPQHKLILIYSSPSPKNSICNDCKESIPANLWSYCCEKCSYSKHLHSCEIENEHKKVKKDAAADAAADATATPAVSSSSFGGFMKGLSNMKNNFKEEFKKSQQAQINKQNNFMEELLKIQQIQAQNIPQTNVSPEMLNLHQIQTQNNIRNDIVGELNDLNLEILKARRDRVMMSSIMHSTNTLGRIG